MNKGKVFFISWLETNLGWLLILLLVLIVVLPGILSLPALCERFNVSKGAAVGNAIGGITAPVIGVMSILLLYLTYNAQKRTLVAQKEAAHRTLFENRVFELIKLYQCDVDSMFFTEKRIDKEMRFVGREVFSRIKIQFKSCIKEIKPFIDTYGAEIMTKQFKEEYEKLGIAISPKEFALLDMAFTIVYIGVDNDSFPGLQNALYERYSKDIVNYVTWNCRLRPFPLNKKVYNDWNIWSKCYDTSEKKEFLPILYRKSDLPQDAMIQEKFSSLYWRKYEKYYTGHQFRLGHYYRLLFMIVNSISQEITISDEDKKKYVRLLRSRLSSTEQLLLMMYSITACGWKWELFLRGKFGQNHDRCKERGYISRYGLVGDVSFDTFVNIDYKKIYPDVEYKNYLNCDDSLPDNSFDDYE